MTVYLRDALRFKVEEPPVVKIDLLSSSTVVPSKEAAFCDAAGLANWGLLLRPSHKHDIKVLDSSSATSYPQTCTKVNSGKHFLQLNCLFESFKY